MPEAAPARPVVLLLEDEPQMVSMLRDNLDGEFEIEVAGTVEEAQLLLGVREFDVFLCDHMVPGKRQGLDFLIEALARQPKAGRVLVSGYLNAELLARSVTVAELDACLTKPVAMAQLRDALQRAARARR
jgi:two-component system response regulator HupR/HoxA